RAALRGLAAWKVEDAPNLLDAALKMPANRHAVAATGLEILLEGPGSRARGLAALNSRYGQPTALRTTALGAFPRLARTAPALQALLANLSDDPNPWVRPQALAAVGGRKIAGALPALRARRGGESGGFSAGPRRRLQEAIDALRGDGSTAGARAAADS